MSRRSLAALALALAAVLAVAGPAPAGSLPTATMGPRPGPDVLYAPLATAPQLENTGIWEADPLMISGAAAHVDGEFVYQDYVYDSYGANTSDLPFAQPDTVPGASDTAFGGATGDMVYPTDAARYGHDAADFLEFRAKRTDDGVTYRITLNTMLDPYVAVVAIGIDTDRDASTGRDDWFYNVGSLGNLGLEHLIAVRATGGWLDRELVPVSSDLSRNQIEVRTPLQPNGAVWRHYAIAGIWGTGDHPEGGFATVLDQPTADQPGGAHGSNPPPVFNVAFRMEVEGDEPMGDAPEELGGRTVGYGHWREHGQAKALAARDISRFSADVDFGLLEAGESDTSLVPQTGHINRLYVSHLDVGEGAKDTRPMLMNKIQPYAIYVPTTYEPGTPAPFHIELHSLSCTYNQYAVIMPNMLQQLGEQRGSFLMTTMGRGPDGWYHHEAEVDLFEAWADAAARYDIDWDRVTLGGYSMGGYGTYKIGAQYPDLFAAGFSIVGPPDEDITGGPTGGDVPELESENNTIHIAENLYNVPLLMWNGGIDELVPVAGPTQYALELRARGLRHEYHVFPTHDHFLFGVIDEWGPAADWLDASVDRNPTRVRYRVMPEMDVPALGLVHDHAYWVEDIRVAPGARSGAIDVQSPAHPSMLVDRDVVGAPLEPTPHVMTGLVWRNFEPPGLEGMHVRLDGVESATLWIERGGVDPTLPLLLTSRSTVPATITLAGSFGTRTLSLPAGENVQYVNL